MMVLAFEGAEGEACFGVVGDCDDDIFRWGNGEEEVGEGNDEGFFDGFFEVAGAVEAGVGEGDDLFGDGGGEAEFEGGAEDEWAEGDFVELEFGDVEEVVLLEFIEDDDVVLADTAEEFWTEVFVDGAGEDFGVAVAIRVETDGLVGGFAGADVGGQDDDDFFEADEFAFAVGEAAFVGDLEEWVEDCGVGFFDFVEEDDAAGIFGDEVGEFAAFAVADVARWRADEFADFVGGGELGHVEGEEGPAGDGGELLNQLGFADAGVAGEEEEAGGFTRVFESEEGALHGGDDFGDGFGLADDVFVEVLLCFGEGVADELEFVGDLLFGFGLGFLIGFLFGFRRCLGRRFFGKFEAEVGGGFGEHLPEVFAVEVEHGEVGVEDVELFFVSEERR